MARAIDRACSPFIPGLKRQRGFLSNQIKIKSIAKVDLFNDPHKLKTALFYEYESTGKKNFAIQYFYDKVIEKLIKKSANEIINNPTPHPLKTTFFQYEEKEISSPIRSKKQSLHWSKDYFEKNLTTIKKSDIKNFSHTFDENFAPIVYYLDHIKYNEKDSLNTNEFRVIKHLLNAKVNPNQKKINFNIVPFSAIKNMNWDRQCYHKYDYSCPYNECVEYNCNKPTKKIPELKDSFITSNLIKNANSIKKCLN